jgi:hypothetical protein
MSRTSDILNKAKILREQHQNDIDEAESRYANSIERYGKLCESKSRYHLERFGTEIEQTQKNLQTLTGQENEHTSEYKYNGENLSKDTKALQESLQAQIKSMNADLQTLKRIEPSNSRASEAEKSPFSSNIVLISIVFAYIEHLSRLRQQEQIQRHKRDAEQSRVSEIARRKHEYSESVGTRRTGVGAFK